MKKNICISALVITIIFAAAGCKSYSIPYDKSFDTGNLETGLYVDQAPPVKIYFAGLQGLFKYSIHENEIALAFYESDVRSIIREEVLKNGEKVSTKFKITLRNENEKILSIPKVMNYPDIDVQDCEYDFSGVPQKIGKDYIFIVKIIKWGFAEMHYTSYAYIDCVVSLVDMKNSKKIWQMEIKKESVFPALMLSYSDAKNPGKVQLLLRDCTAGIIQDIALEFNKNE